MQNQDTPKPPADSDQTTGRVGVGRCDLFAIERDGETYLIRDESGKNRMSMIRSGKGPWELYRIGEGHPMDRDTFRHDLLERHGICIANA